MKSCINYQKILDNTIDKIKLQEKVPTLVLHSCCAPCSSYVLEYLSNYFKITVLFYNPNIYPPTEFQKRSEEQRKLIQEMPLENTVEFIEVEYDESQFYAIAKGVEQEPEGGLRCSRCYKLRLEQAAIYASENKMDFFTTTLSISPLKDSEQLNQIGQDLSECYHVNYLFSDFKKRNGYKRSLELSNLYNLYRQNYCGCIYSIKR